LHEDSVLVLDFYSLFPEALLSDFLRDDDLGERLFGVGDGTAFIVG